MSYVSVLGLRPGEPSVELVDFRNAFLCAPALWEWIGRVHVGPGFELFAKDGMDRVWRLLDDPAVPLSHRRALAMTHPRAVIREADHRDAASDLGTLPPEAGRHWPAIAHFLADGGAAGYPMIAIVASVDESPFPEMVEDEDGEEVLREFDWSTVLDVYEAVR